MGKKSFYPINKKRKERDNPLTNSQPERKNEKCKEKIEKRQFGFILWIPRAYSVGVQCLPKNFNPKTKIPRLFPKISTPQKRTRYILFLAIFSNPENRNNAPKFYPEFEHFYELWLLWIREEIWRIFYFLQTTLTDMKELWPTCKEEFLIHACLRRRNEENIKEKP